MDVKSKLLYRSKVWWLLVFSVLGLILVGGGKLLSDSLVARAQGQDITINGTLRNYRTGAPVANANVTVWIPNAFGWLQSSFTTDANGQYTVSLGVGPGNYYLEFDSIDTNNDGVPEYPSQWHDAAAEPVGYKGDRAWARPVNLAPGDNKIETKLDPYITIVGTLVDAGNNQPIADASGTIRIWDKAGNGLANVTTGTDGDGKYTATFRVPLRPGKYLLEYEGFGYPTQFLDYAANPQGIKKWREDATPVELKPGENQLGNTLLSPYAELSGTLFDAETGQRISNRSVSITLYEKTYDGSYDHRGWRYFSTDDEGRYTIGDLRPGVYKLAYHVYPYPEQYHDDKNPGQQVLWLAQQVELKSGTNKLESRLHLGYRISGRVTDAATKKPIEDWLSVNVYAPDGRLMDEQEVWTSGGEYTVVARPGTYLLEYRVNGYTGTWYNNKPNQAQADVLDLTQRSAADVNVSLEPTSTATGTIEGTITDEKGKGIGNVYVCAEDSESWSPDWCETPYAAYTGPDGTYTLSLPVGKYKLLFRHSDYQDEYYNDAASWLLAEWVSVQKDQKTTINAKLAARDPYTPGLGTLTVYLKDSSGKKPAYVNANLYLDQAVGGPNQWNALQPNQWDLFTGTFTYTNVPVGQYKLYVEPRVQYESMWVREKGSFASPYDHQYAYDTAQIIEIVGGKREELTVTLIERTETTCSGQSIKGTVKREDNGTPATGRAELYDGFSSAFLGSRCLDNGTYEFKCVEPGTYKVRFVPDDDSSDLIGEYWNDKKDRRTAQVIELKGGAPFIADAQLATAPGTYRQVVTVKTSKGDPVSGIGVSVSGPRGGWERTDAQGQVWFNLIQGEEYQICTEAEEVYLRTCLPDPVVGTSAERREATIIVDVGGKIVGQVLDDVTGKPIRQVVQVEIFHHSHETPITNAQIRYGGTGAYEIRNLPAGKYKLQFRAPGYYSSYADAAKRWEDGKIITVEEGQTVREDERLTPIPPDAEQGRGTITGVVTHAPNKQPSWRVEVILHRVDQGAVYDEWRTGPDGAFSFRDIPVGKYELEFRPPKGSGFVRTWWTDASGKKTIDLTNETVFDASITLQRPSYAIKGQLLDRVTGKPIARTVGNIRIVPKEQTVRPFEQPIETDQNGNYTAYVPDDIASGKVYLWFSGLDNNYPGQWHVGDNQPAQFELDNLTGAAEVSFGNSKEVEVVSRLHPYAVYQGKLVDNNGAAIAHAEGKVVFYKQNETGGYEPVVSRFIKTDREGNFTVKGSLIDGTYKVSFSNFKGYPTQWHDSGRRSLDLADPITLSPGSSSPIITTRLVPGTPIRGVLRDSVTKKMIGNAPFVIAFQQAGNPEQQEWISSESGRTDYPSGAFEVWVFPGTYRARISLHSGDYDDAWYDTNRPADKTATEFTVGSTLVDFGTQDMRPRGTIQGKVTDVSGKGIGGVQVRVYDENGVPVKYGLTAEQAEEGKAEVGEYSISQVPAGNYRLSFTPPFGSNYLEEYYNDKDNLFQADTVSLAAGGKVEVNTTLAEGRVLVVKVLEEGGSTLPIWANLSLYDASLYEAWSFGAHAIAPSDFDLDTATYTFTRLLDRKYRLFAGAEGYASEWYQDVAAQDNFAGFRQATDIDLTKANTAIEVKLGREVGQGTIRGKVTDKDGNPIAGSWVRLLNPLTREVFATDDFVDQGNYEFTNLPSGLYVVGFAAPGYAEEFYDDQYALDHAKVIAITDNQVIADAKLEAAGRLGVTVVTDQDGKPLAGVELRATHTEWGADLLVGETDANGQAILSGPPGTYFLQVLPRGNYIGIERTENYKVVANGQTDVTIRMKQGGQIVGKILDHLTGLPVDLAGWGTEIELFRDDVPQRVQNVSWDVGPDGSYIIKGLPAGTYRISYRVPSYRPSFASDDSSKPADRWEDGKGVTVAAGKTTTQDVRLWPEENGTITGRVTLSVTGRGVAGVQVGAFDAESGEMVREATTDHNGYYVIAGLEPNRKYLLRYMPPNAIGFAMEWYDNAATMRDAKAISLTANQVVVADAQLEPAVGVITGRVTSGDRKESLVGVAIQAYRKDDRSLAGVAITGHQGAYQIKGLRPDVDYIVMAQGRAEYSGHWYNNKTRWTIADTVRPTTKSPVVTGVDFVLGKAGIEGYVTDSSGRRLPNIPVWIYSTEFGTQRHEHFTDGAGYFRAEGLLPGDYTVEAQTIDDVLVTTYYGGTADWRQAKPVPVGIDGMQRANITMITGDTLTGKVVAEGTNTGLAQVGVEVHGRMGWFWKKVFTDADGNFTVKGLAPNSAYSFMLTPPETGDAAKYPTQWHDRTLFQHDAQEVKLPYSGSLIIQLSEKPADIPLDQYGSDLQPTYSSMQGAPGSVVRHTLTVTNTGAVIDTYQLDYQSKWRTVVKPYPVVGPVAPGKAVQVMVDVAVPESALLGDSDEVMLRLTSKNNLGSTKGAILVTTAARKFYGVLVSPQSMAQQAEAGSVVSYTLDIINTGNVADRYDLAAEMGRGTTWSVTVEPRQVGPVNPGQRASVQVRVSVPANAAGGATGVATLTATSKGDPTKSAQSTLTTTVKVAAIASQVIVAPSEVEGSGVAGMRSRYTLQVWNLGTTVNTYTVALSGNTWETQVSHTALSIEPGAHATIVVSVTIPLSARGGNEDKAIIRVTSRNDATKTSSAVVKTKVAHESFLVQTSGGSFTTSDGRLKVIVPALGRMIRIAYTLLIKPQYPLGSVNISSADAVAAATPKGVSYFALKVYDAQTGEAIETLDAPAEVWVSYTNEQLQNAGVSNAATLGVLFWDGTQWVKQSSQNNQANQVLIFQTTKLGDFAVAGVGDGKSRIFLPVIQR